MNLFFQLFLGGIGYGEMIILLIVILIIFGAGKLPQIGEALGKGIKNFKKAVSGDEQEPKQLNSGTQNQKPEITGANKNEEKKWKK